MATTSHLGGYCQRCGDPVAGKLRCSRCGGTSAAPKIRSSAPPLATQPVDRWASRYVSGSFSPDDPALPSTNPPPSSSRPAVRSSVDHSVGLGLPSRISKDLRTSTSGQLLGLDQPAERGRSLLSTPPSNSGPASRDRSPNGGDYSAPILKSSDGILSKVCGSLVEPSSSRDKWACHGCAAVFARDTTIYAAPQSSASKQAADSQFFCRDCYAERFSMGLCQGCGKDVLGSTKEDGRFVKATAGIWHGRCWKCTSCGTSSKDGAEIIVGMDGRPCCETCFDKPFQPRRTSVDVQRSSEQVPDIRRLNRPGGPGRAAMGATIAELSKRFGNECSTTSRPPLSPALSGNQSPTRSAYSFPDLLTRSPSKSGAGLSRSGSITGSPPKPRPLTAQFTDELNLAAFRTSFAGGAETDSSLLRRDSRSRSVSPSKRPSPKLGVPATETFKVPGSPNMAPTTSTSATGPADPARRTASGFPRPMNTPFSKSRKEPIQGDKLNNEPEPEPEEADTRCAVCRRLALEGSQGEVVMLTLSGGEHLHASCFTCAICRREIDGRSPFVRLDEGGGHAPLAEVLGAFAHPSCAPAPVPLRVVREPDSRRTSLGGGSERSHVTHQRELRPVPEPRVRVQPQPARQPVATRVNPAAGMFARSSAPASRPALGGMNSCPGCGARVSPLESVTGPRSTQWHRKCLACTCGKRLDSAAKVNAAGEVRCRTCFDSEHSAFPRFPR